MIWFSDEGPPGKGETLGEYFVVKGRREVLIFIIIHDLLHNCSSLEGVSIYSYGNVFHHNSSEI